jgi:methylglutaconyl-CoA hydratase
VAENYGNLRRTDEGPVTTVALARPEARNALDAAIIGEITRCFEDLAEDESVRVVVLTGEGPAFCAGADVGYMRETGGFS